MKEKEYGFQKASCVDAKLKCNRHFKRDTNFIHSHVFSFCVMIKRIYCCQQKKVMENFRILLSTSQSAKFYKKFYETIRIKVRL